jgi:hypothetical protein
MTKIVFLTAAGIIAAILALKALGRMAKLFIGIDRDSRDGDSVEALMEIGELLGGRVVKGHGARESCSRCGRVFKPQPYLQDHSIIIGIAGNETNQAYQCTEPTCRRWYCTECAKQEVRSTGKAVGVFEFDLCCDCGSADFRRLPVTYVSLPNKVIDRVSGPSYPPRLITAPNLDFGHPQRIVKKKQTPGCAWAISARQFLASHNDQYLDQAIVQSREQLLGRSVLSILKRDLDLRISALLSAWKKADIRTLSTYAPLLAKRLRDQGREEEADTIALLHDEILIQIAEDYLSLPVSKQAQALKTGLKTCALCVEIAERLGDDLCAASYLTRLGNGLFTIGNFEESVRAFEFAISKWGALLMSGHLL